MTTKRAAALESPLIFILLLLITNAGFCAEPARHPSLRTVTAGLFTIGVGIHDRIPERPADWPLLIAQFSSVTPENCLKPDPIQIAEGKFNFVRSDAFVNFANSNGLE